MINLFGYPRDGRGKLTQSTEPSVRHCPCTNWMDEHEPTQRQRSVYDTARTRIG